MVTVEQILNLLQLQRHPAEGGYFAETYRAEESFALQHLPSRYQGARSYSTAIYYLLTADTFSAMHRLRSDEIYHFYLGDPVEMLQLWPDGGGRVLLLGQDIVAGMKLQVVVPRGVWQGSRLLPGGQFALLGTTTAPGFEYADFEAGGREALIAAYPQFHDRIVALTPGV